jgi:hypothetical protein
MKFALGRLTFETGAAFALMWMIATAVWAGGLGGNHQHDKASYFGFVKDANGKIIAEARVKADLKGRAAMVTRTNALGMYKIPELTKDIGPNDVTISCSKEGYRQIRIFRRTPQNAKPPIQIECTMQRLSAQ